MNISCNGSKVTELLDTIIFTELKFYEFFIANIIHHLLKQVPSTWDGNFNLSGLVVVLQELYNVHFSIEDEEVRKTSIEESNKLLAGLVNIFNEKVLNTIQTKYKLPITELPYITRLYIIELPFEKSISRSVTLSMSNSGFFDFGRYTSEQLLDITISEKIDKE